MKNIKILKKSSKSDCQNTTQEKQTLPIAKFIFVATTAGDDVDDDDRGGAMNSGGGGITVMGGNAGRVQQKIVNFCD